MEPQRVTYKVLIDLEAKPISYKSFETICGDTYKYADRYPTPNKLANDINLDVSHFQIDQTLGDNSEFYRFTSLTNYYQEAQRQSKHRKFGIKVEFCNSSKQVKSFADNLDTRKMRPDSLSC